MLAMEAVREHNNLNACNHRRPIQAAHQEIFPGVDFSAIEVNGPPPRAEWADVYKDAFSILRGRAERAMDEIDARPEDQVAVSYRSTQITQSR